MAALVVFTAGAAAPSRAEGVNSAEASSSIVVADQARQAELSDWLAVRAWAADRASRSTVTVTVAPPAPPVTRPHVDRPKRPAVKAAVRPRLTVRVGAPSAGRAAAVVQFALAQLGKPYVWAADGPEAFDCSGLALAAYARVGIRLPHFTGGIVDLGRPVSRSQLMPGDLVFPSSGHVGIYIGRGRMVHAPKPGDHVRVADVYAFWTARRLL